MVRKLQEAERNFGQVHLMRDRQDGERLVAVKQVPNVWLRSSPSEFLREHPSETENPWQDIGCTNFLNHVGYPFACRLLGVYRDDEHSYIVTSFATEGDLFSWCENSALQPGHEREVVVLPIARQIIEGVQQLHDLSIVHQDISLENLLLSQAEDCSLHIRIIDFSMASTSCHFRGSALGKPVYQAPEFHEDEELGYDGFLSDAFAVGVTLYALVAKDYPWLTTKPGGCKLFEYVRKQGFRKYVGRRKLRGSTARVADIMSEPLMQLLEGLLQLDPAKRLTLGERVWKESEHRRSVWDMAWLQTGPGQK
jgi:serine/threonine protein kinase